MKNLIILSFFGLLLTGCSNDDSLSSADRNVISDGSIITFDELLILINLKTTDSTYLVIKSIDSVSIYVNNMFWTKINSQIIDTSKVNKVIVNNQYLSKRKINYLIVASQNNKPSDFNTAGEYANYLNSIYTLKPGEYACLIESFQITFNDNSIHTYHPYEYTTFKVEPNTKSAFAGEIEIKIE